MSVNVDLAQHGLSEALGLFASLDIKNRRGSIWTSHDWSILGLGCSRFMIHESGSMFGFARVGNSLTPPRVATMNAYDSIERGVVDEGERRRPRTFTLTQLLVACVAVSCCTLAATTVVNTHRGLANFGDPGTEAIKQQYEDVMKKQAEAVKAAASRYEAMIKQAEHIDAMETQAEAIREAKEAEAMEKQAEAIRKHMEAMKKQAEAKAAADKETGPENAEKKRKAEEKERECDRQATEKRNQCLTQPAPGSSLRIDGAQLGGMGAKPD